MSLVMPPRRQLAICITICSVWRLLLSSQVTFKTSWAEEFSHNTSENFDQSVRRDPPPRLHYKQQQQRATYSRHKHTLCTCKDSTELVTDQSPEVFVEHTHQHICVSVSLKLKNSKSTCKKEECGWTEYDRCKFFKIPSWFWHISVLCLLIVPD